MIQIKRGAATVATVNPLSSSNMSKAVMGEEQITLVWEAPAFVSFSVSDYITVEGSNWTLNRLPTVKKLSSKLWQYNAVFQSTKYDLIKAMYLLFDNTETLPAGEFSLTGTADTFMELLVSNLNRVAGSAVWAVGDVIENTDYKNLTFSNEDCLSVLARLADEFDTEYHVANHTIHLKRISTVREVTLEYGSTLYDIERSSVDSSDVVTRLYPFGSTKNLASDYRGGNSPLRIPVANGNYIENNVSLYGVIERAMTFEDIYPRLSSGGAGVITGVGNEFTFTDSALDFDVNSYLLDGTTAKVHFNTGECAGYDFEIASYNNTTKTFVLIANNQENGFTLPTATLKPSVDNKYVLLDIIMPDIPYLDNAESELLAKSQEYINQNSTPKVSYKTTFSAIYARQNLQSVECGDTVTVYDADMGINEQIRIIKLQKGLTDFWNVQFDLANTVTATRLERVEGTVAAVENTVVVANQRINRNNLRAYQNNRELREQVFDPDGFFDAGNIKPESISTAMIDASAKSQIFQTTVVLKPNHVGNPQSFYWSSGVLAHFTIAENETKEWVFSDGGVTITGPSQTTFLNIYARCSKSANTADIYLSTDKIKFYENETHWLFWIGMLHTPIDGVRGISLTYGQTLINGGFIKTGCISSHDGATYFNLNTGEIGGNIKFRSTSGTLKTVETAIGEIEISGINTFTNEAYYVDSWSSDNSHTFDKGQVDCPYGFYFVGNQAADNTCRITNAISAIGYWTVSWEMRGSQNDNVGVSVDICGQGSKRFLTSDDNKWNRYELTVNLASLYDLDHVDFYNFAWDYFYIRNIKIEKGNKATGFSVAPEVLALSVAEAKEAGTVAMTEAGQAKQAVTDLSSTMNGAFADGVIDASEAISIGKYTSQVTKEFNELVASYDVIFANSYLTGTAKTNLTSAKGTLTTAKTNLLDAIEAILAATPNTIDFNTKKAIVSAKFTLWDSAFADYKSKLEAANKAIQDELDRLSGQKVADIVIGGANLLNGSVLGTGWGVNDGAGLISTFTTLGRQWTNITAQSNECYFWLRIDIAEPNVEYTFSFDLLGTTPLEIQFGNFQFKQTYNAASDTIPLRVVKTFKWEAEPQHRVAFFKIPANGWGNRISNVQLEKGNKATNYSLSSEDVQSNINAARDRALLFGAGKNLFPQAELQDGINWWRYGYSHISLNATNKGVNYSSDWSLNGNMDIRNNQGLNTIYMVHGAFVNEPQHYAYLASDPIKGIQGGKKYIFSIYAASHRSQKVECYITFHNSNGAWLGDSFGQTTSWLFEEAAGGQNINGYKRIYCQLTAPQDAVRADVAIRKYGTAQGCADSYAFLCRPMLEQVDDLTTQPGVWTPYASGAEVAGSKALLADIASDGKLTPNEKQIALREWQAISNEYGSVDIEAEELGLSDVQQNSTYNDFVNYYNALKSYLTIDTIAPNAAPLLSNMSTTSDIVAVTFNQKFANAKAGIVSMRHANSNALKAKAEAAGTVANAITNNLTTIDGGLILTTLIKMLNGGVESAGMAAKTPTNDIAFWGGGTLEQAIQRSTAFGVTHGGNAWFKGLIEAMNGGKIGQFDILGNNIVGKDSNGVEKIKIGLQNIASSPGALAVNSMISAAQNYSDGSFLVYINQYEDANYNTYYQQNIDGNTFLDVVCNINIPYSTYISVDYPQEFFNLDYNINNLTVSYITTVYVKNINTNAVITGQVQSNINISTAGAYEITLRFVFNANMRDAQYLQGDSTNPVSFGSAMTVAYNAAVQKTEIGLNGFYSYWSNLLYFYFSQEYGLSYRGALDIPGVLASGAVNAGRVQDLNKLWGAKTNSSNAGGSGGTYHIYHNVGNTNYTVQITTNMTARFGSVTAKYDSYFVVEIRDLSNSAQTSGFEYVVFGNN